jgi:hypothetical protein
LQIAPRLADHTDGFPPRTFMLPYAFAIFTGAFLLFQVQPVIGKYILPWFGGGPGVWTTCLLFFQVLLLGGYGYAHWSSTRLKPRTQAIVHLVLLALAIATLPITPSEMWKAHIAGNPTWRILLLLGGTIGLPYFVLSSTGPLMQQWFSTTNRGVSPYRLYALSNIGSLLALLSYPVYFEVAFSRRTQANLWSAGLIVFAAACGYCAIRVWRAGAAPVVADPTVPEPSTEIAAHPSWGDKFLWVTLPAIASVLLLATTNKLCQEVAVIPFLWVLPLSLYLLSFIICFDHARWYSRGIFAALLVVGIAVVCQLLVAGNTVPMAIQITSYTGTLFVACMICHGEVYQLRPSPRFLTSYYLLLSAGGALGGLLVAVVAPAVFSDYHELQLGLWALSYLLGVLCFRQRSWSLAFGAGAGAMITTFVLPILRSRFDDGFSIMEEWLRFYRLPTGSAFPVGQGFFIFGFLVLFVTAAFDPERRRLLREWRPRLVGFVMVLSVGLGIVLLVQARATQRQPIIAASRNFYGALKVFEYNADDPEDHYYLLLHGATTHGLQFTAPEKQMIPTTYYGENSGVGLAIKHLPRPAGERRLGLVGLGTGTLASYGTHGDYLRIYEINPAVERLARTRFQYLPRCAAKVDVIMGDARLSMEREIAAHESQQFDLLALDAFSSDAIPVHLLTKESFALYLQHLRPDGVLAVHTSNRYLDLRPVVERLAREFSLSVATIHDDDETSWWIYRTTWILVTKNKALLEEPEIRDVTDSPATYRRPPPLWTDDHTSLYPILR